MAKGSRKGGAFERRCAKMISLYLTDGESDSELIRSVSSGGWSRRKVRQVGDLAPNGPAGEEFRQVFGIECKNRQSWEWRHLWTSDDPAVMQWWRKHREECDEADLVPLMIFTANYEPLYVMYPFSLGVYLAFEAPLCPVEMDVTTEDANVTVVRWDDLITRAAPDVLMECGRRMLGE